MIAAISTGMPEGSVGDPQTLCSGERRLSSAAGVSPEQQAAMRAAARDGLNKVQLGRLPQEVCCGCCLVRAARREMKRCRSACGTVWYCSKAWCALSPHSWTSAVARGCLHRRIVLKSAACSQSKGGLARPQAHVRAASGCCDGKRARQWRGGGSVKELKAPSPLQDKTAVD